MQLKKEEKFQNYGRSWVSQPRRKAAVELMIY
jgi:hypothetical protein